MKALTLWQPWATSIATLGKPVENRGWKPPDSLIGEQLAIHAGRTVSREAIDDLRMEGFEIAEPVITSAVVCVVRVVGWIREGERGFAASPAISARTLEHVTSSIWWSGPVGWVVVDPIAIEPVPCPGHQGLWDLPPHVESSVREQLLARRSA